jgi:hypothetical protein
MNSGSLAFRESGAEANRNADNPPTEVQTPRHPMSLLFRVPPRIARQFFAPPTCLSSRLHTSRRNLATHKDPYPNAPSLLSQQLDQATTRHRARTGGGPQADSVGPFVLGIPPSKLKSGPDAKKWSELSASGKGMRHLVLCVG